VSLALPICLSNNALGHPLAPSVFPTVYHPPVSTVTRNQPPYQNTLLYFHHGGENNSHLAYSTLGAQAALNNQPSPLIARLPALLTTISQLSTQRTLQNKAIVMAVCSIMWPTSACRSFFIMGHILRYNIEQVVDNQTEHTP
jgi:hypothetical protein